MRNSKGFRATLICGVLVAGAAVVLVAISTLKDRSAGSDRHSNKAGTTATSSATDKRSGADKTMKSLPAKSHKDGTGPSVAKRTQGDLATGSGTRENPDGAANQSLNPSSDPEGTNAPAMPPMEPDAPLSMTAQILDLVQKSDAEAGPESGAMGEQLLKAGEPILRVAGAAILSKDGPLADEILKALAGDPSNSVPVNVIGWLHDTGHAGDSDKLTAILIDNGITANQLTDLLASGQLTGSGSRAALDLLRLSIDPEEARAMYDSLTSDSARDYSVRMKSAILMRETLEFSAYKAEVDRLSSLATDTDPIWKEGISRLAVKLEGPEIVHQAPPALVPSDIDEMLAREYPMMLEDLALRVEYTLSKTNSYVASGTADKLKEHLTAFDDLPWTDEQQVSLMRLKAASDLLPAFETKDPPPPTLPSPPPGM